MKKLILLLSVILLVSCASENEQKALDSIAENFNAKTSYSKGFESNVGQKTYNKFNIKVSESEMLDSIAPAFSSGAIALMGYKSFSAEEKEKYDDIDVEFISSKQDTSTFIYSKDILKLLAEKDSHFTRFSEAVVKKDISVLEEMADNTTMQKGHSNIILTILTNIEKEYGTLEGYIPSGIGQSKYNNGSMIIYRALLQFEKEDVFYTCNFDITSGKNKVIGYVIDPKL